MVQACLLLPRPSVEFPGGSYSVPLSRSLLCFFSLLHSLPFPLLSNTKWDNPIFGLHELRSHCHLPQKAQIAIVSVFTV